MKTTTNRRTAALIAGITLAITGAANASVSPDFNQSGGVGLDDLQAFMAAYSSGAKTADANGDGQITYTDVFTFIQQWTTAYIKEPKKVTPPATGAKKVSGITGPASISRTN